VILEYKNPWPSCWFLKNKSCHPPFCFGGTICWWKSNSYYPSVIGFILVTYKEGYPIAWEVVPGKTTDQAAFSKIAKRICKKYNVTEITYCFDRGVASLKVLFRQLRVDFF